MKFAPPRLRYVTFGKMITWWDASSTHGRVQFKKENDYLVRPSSTHGRVRFKKKNITWWDQTRLMEEFDFFLKKR